MILFFLLGAVSSLRWKLHRKQTERGFPSKLRECRHTTVTAFPPEQPHLKYKIRKVKA